MTCAGSCMPIQFAYLLSSEWMPQNEGMTIEELAASSQREYESTRNEMATRAELKVVEGNILRAIEGLGLQLGDYASRWNGEFDNLTDAVQAIEHRVNLLERSNGTN